MILPRARGGRLYDNWANTLEKDSPETTHGARPASNTKKKGGTTCAACHGFDGAALNWGSEEDPNYVATEAKANPRGVMAKIRHGHPGVEMISCAAFDMQTAADVLAYAQTLKTK